MLTLLSKWNPCVRARVVETAVDKRIQQLAPRIAKLLAAALFSLMASVPNVWAQLAKPLSVDDSLHTRRFGENFPIASSPDNQSIAFVSRPTAGVSGDPEAFHRTGVMATAKGSDIYLLDASSGREQNLTGAIGSNWHPVWSPDGKYLAFLSDRDGSDQARLWVWDAKTKSTHRVSEINIRGDEIVWMPDSQRILFTTLPAGLSVDEYVKRFVSAPDGKKPDSLRSPGATVTLYHAEPAVAGISEGSKSAPWSLDWALRDLAIANVLNGRVESIVTGKRIAKYFVTPDGTHVAYTSPKQFANAGSQLLLFDIVLVDLIAKKSQSVASDAPMGFGGEEVELSPDGTKLVFRELGAGRTVFHVIRLTSREPQELWKLPVVSREVRGLSRGPMWNQAGDQLYYVKDGAIWIGSLDQAEPRLLCKIPGFSITRLLGNTESPHIWIRNDRSATVVLAQDEASKEDAFFEIDLIKGYSSKLLQTGECFTCALQDDQVVATRDGERFYYFAETAGRDSDIWMSDTDFTKRRRLTHLNPQFDNYVMGRSQLVSWLSDDGELLHGALLLPAGYQPGNRYPLLVWIYGGGLPSGQVSHFGLGFFGPFNMQFFATRGFAVLLPDSPQHEGTPMLDLVKTVLPGVNKVVEMGIADANRLGIMGHSNGGYSVLGLITQTTRFRAAIEMDGFSDIVGEYSEMDKTGNAFGTSLFEHAIDGLGGTPWQVPVRYAENSPIFYFDQVKTPLLIVHGGDDTTVPPFLGDEVFVGLRRLGKEVEYAKYAGEGHSPIYWAEANQIDVCNRMINWFAKYLVRESQAIPSAVTESFPVH